jgi:molybdenum cofactor cytidylyltransferase
MGQPKMLLDFNGKTLLQHIIDEAKKLNDATMLVVTGCYHALLKDILQSQQIPFIQNEQWEEGMGTSIQRGITELLQHYSDAENVIIMVCDQPYISSGLLQEMIHTKQTTGKGIVACTYNDTTGTPVLFDKKYFSRLAMLQGQQGAKKMIQQFKEDTATISFPEGAIDIDTPGDYNKLKGLS